MEALERVSALMLAFVRVLLKGNYLDNSMALGMEPAMVPLKAGHLGAQMVLLRGSGLESRMVGRKEVRWARLRVVETGSRMERHLVVWMVRH